jgi:hypothetical protein
MKATPSYEACMKAYKIILPTFIEIAKKEKEDKQRSKENKSGK